MSMLHISQFPARSKMTNIQHGDIQPNAVDVRLSKLFRFETNNHDQQASTFYISEDEKRHRSTVEMQPDSAGSYHLAIGHYEVLMENTVEIVSGEAGWVVARSTLNRNGVFITSGIYDSGYSGQIGGLLHVTAGPMVVVRGTRIAQFVLFQAEVAMLYNGSYGINKPHDVKYQ